jgi:hypothetical protein
MKNPRHTVQILRSDLVSAGLEGGAFLGDDLLEHTVSVPEDNAISTCVLLSDSSSFTVTNEHTVQAHGASPRAEEHYFA